MRLVILLLTSLVALSIALSLDMLLGAFAAGVIAKLLLADATPHDAEIIEGKLEAVGFGFFVPVFFINTGVTFDLQALLSSTPALLLLPVFLILLLVVRGLPGLLSAPPGSVGRGQARHSAVQRHRSADHRGGDRDRGRSGDLPAGTASALVGAGMLSVLLFPLLALGQHRQAPDGAPEAAGPVTRASSRRADRRPGTVVTGDQCLRRSSPSSRCHPADRQRQCPAGRAGQAGRFLRGTPGRRADRRRAEHRLRHPGLPRPGQPTALADDVRRVRLRPCRAAAVLGAQPHRLAADGPARPNAGHLAMAALERPVSSPT